MMVTAARPLATAGPSYDEGEQKATAYCAQPDEPGRSRRVFHYFRFIMLSFGYRFSNGFAVHGFTSRIWFGANSLVYDLI